LYSFEQFLARGEEQKKQPQKFKLKEHTMTWTHSNTIGLSQASCTSCKGLGMCPQRNGSIDACNCVLRAAFRACYARFKACVASQRSINPAGLEFHGGGRDSRRSPGRRNEDYIADFCGIAKRRLLASDYKLFALRYLHGADHNLCGNALGMNRGNVYHGLYEIEQRLGRIFAELRPYALYPPVNYFQNSGGARVPATVPQVPAHSVLPLRAPLEAQPTC
jgi:hypothetical protein